VADDTPDGLIFAEAQVTGTDLSNAASGTIAAIVNVSPGSFSADSRTALANSTRDLLVFIHGFDNAFKDAITRAAFNREYLAQSGLPAANMDVLAFTWPSSGLLIAAPPDFPDAAYRADQARASESGYQLAHFLNELSSLFTGFDPAGNRRVILLAHSMGNWALQAGVEAFFAQAPTPPLRFDEVVLAAADEVANTFEAPDGGRLSLLRNITRRVSVYCNARDDALALSSIVNGNARLGQAGPTDKTDAALYPPATFRTVDCTDVFDYNQLDPIDATHQYYRLSGTVRGDIATLIGGANVEPGVSALHAAPLIA
jgi:esterase/lipase superfamily enzyme